jgi:hypothetical protein
MNDKPTQTIKDAYKNMLEIVKLNEPEVYLMPVSLFNEIMKKIGYLENALKDARQSRDNWRKKYENGKK